MRESERATARMRDDAIKRGLVTVTIEHHEVASALRASRARAGAGVRLTRVDIDPRRVDDAIAAYEDTALPWLTEAQGICSALLFVHRHSGRSIHETIWRTAGALADSRAREANMRVDSVAASDALIRALEEYELAFTTAGTVPSTAGTA
jgi:hypothetical protein